MKTIFVTGCPRSGTTFYSMELFKNVDGFSTDPMKSYEPKALHDAQYNYLKIHNDQKKLYENFLAYISSIEKKQDDYLILKQPFFSFILPEILNFPFEKKIILIKRPFTEILASRLNFKNSLTQVLGAYDTTWLSMCGVQDYRELWNKGNLRKRMEIYVAGQQKIEEKFDNHQDVITINYGENPISLSKFVKELSLTEKQKQQFHENFQKHWKNEGYKKFREKNKKEAKVFLDNLKK